MCPSAPRVCSEPGGQKLVLSLSLDLIASTTKLHSFTNNTSSLNTINSLQPWSYRVYTIKCTHYKISSFWPYIIEYFVRIMQTVQFLFVYCGSGIHGFFRVTSLGQSYIYHQISNIRCILVASKTVVTQMLLEHCLSALPQLHLHSWLNTWLQWIGQRQLQDKMRNI